MYVSEKTVGRAGTQSSIGQADASTRGPRGRKGGRAEVIIQFKIGQRDAGTRTIPNEHQARMHSLQVSVVTNAPQFAKEVGAMSCGAKLQEALDMGAKEQRQHDERWILGALTITTLGQPMCWGDLTGEPLDIDEVKKARAIDIEYFNTMQVYGMVPLQEARDGGDTVLGVRWVDVKKVDCHTNPGSSRRISACTVHPSCSRPRPPLESLRHLMRRVTQDSPLRLVRS